MGISCQTDVVSTSFLRHVPAGDGSTENWSLNHIAKAGAKIKRIKNYKQMSE